jgi:hypothetical protein
MHTISIYQNKWASCENDLKQYQLVLDTDYFLSHDAVVLTIQFSNKDHAEHFYTKWHSYLAN